MNARRLVLSAAFLSLTSCDGPTGLDEAPGRILVAKLRGPSGFEIWVMRPDGSDARQLTFNNVRDAEASWSPDGQRIVFTRSLDSIPGAEQHSEIHVMNADGTGVRKLTEGQLSAQSPRWSPDGTRIAFDRFLPGGWRRIFVMNADGSNVQVLPPQTGLLPDWSPDGNRLLFIGSADWQLHVMNADGTGVHALGGDTACAGLIRAARWSPDGTHIAYTCDPNGASLWTMRADGTAPREVRAPNTYGSPVWSPDGRYIAFNAIFADNRREVVAVRSGGGSETRVTNDPDFDLVSDWK